MAIARVLEDSAGWYRDCSALRMRSLYVCLGMALLVAGSACSKKDSPTAPTQGAAIALSGNMNFGNVTVGSTFASTLTIANSGASPLTITSVTYPTGFSGNFASGTIAAG